MKNTEKYITFAVPIKKEVTRSDKNGKKIIKNVTYNVPIAQDLWRAYCQILSIIFLKKYVKLNVNTDRIMRNVKFAEWNTNIATNFLNIQRSCKDDLIEQKLLCCNENYNKKFDKNFKKRFFNTYKFSNH